MSQPSKHHSNVPSPATIVAGAGLLAALAVAAPAVAGFTVDEGGKLELEADFRLREESDWDSQRADGSSRADRDRLRVRARLGLTLRPRKGLELGVRLRTGSHASQQSPHITIHDFDDNPRGDAEILPDRYYLAIRGERSWAWFGRNGYPFFRQNELFWDDDVTPLGAALGTDLAAGDSWKLGLTAGFFATPDGGLDFSGTLGAGQVVYRADRGDWKLTLAAGTSLLRGEPGAEHLRHGNGDRDYTIWSAGAQARTVAADRPLSLGLDLAFNSEDYDGASDSFTVANRDQRTGFVASARYGGLKQPNDWLVGWWYAHVETLAIHASYAQDDWVRWGSATQTDASDLEGHEIRVAWVPWKNSSLVARLYLVEAITSDQDGKRFRLDFNYKL